MQAVRHLLYMISVLDNFQCQFLADIGSQEEAV